MQLPWFLLSVAQTPMGCWKERNIYLAGHNRLLPVHVCRKWTLPETIKEILVKRFLLIFPFTLREILRENLREIS